MIWVEQNTIHIVRPAQHATTLAKLPAPVAQIPPGARQIVLTPYELTIDAPANNSPFGSPDKTWTHYAARLPRR